MEVVLEDGSICTDTDIILNTWTTAYENLLNCDDVELCILHSKVR
jgi:hypothetical protein